MPLFFLRIPPLARTGGGGPSKSHPKVSHTAGLNTSGCCRPSGGGGPVLPQRSEKKELPAGRDGLSVLQTYRADYVLLL